MTVARAESAADYYRVIEVAGSQSLPLRSGPAQGAPIVVELPFDARALRPTGVRERGWVQLTVVTSAHEEFTGWARNDEVVADDGYAPTVYRIVDAGTYGAAVRSENGWGSVIGTIPSGARGVLAIGVCEEGFCPVRYVGRKRRLEGWVSASYLAVAGGPAGGLEDDTHADPIAAPGADRPDDAPRFTARDDGEMATALRDAAGPTPYATPRQRGFWWGVLHPRQALHSRQAWHQ